MVIPAMGHIDTTFTNGILNAHVLDPAIRAALKLAKRTLNRYYSLTDASETYHVAMGTLSSTLPSYDDANFMIFSLAVLHPQHKLQYFQNAGWETEWVTTAEHLMRELYDQSYGVQTVAQGVNAGDEVSFMSPCPSLF